MADYCKSRIFFKKIGGFYCSVTIENTSLFIKSEFTADEAGW